MLICGHCGGLVRSLSDLAVHLRCEEKPQELVVVENTSTNTLRDAISALRDLVSEVDYHKESCYQTDHLDYCLTRAKDVLKQHPLEEVCQM